MYRNGEIVMKEYRLKFMIASAVVSYALELGAQTPTQQPEIMQQKIQQMQQSAVRNEQQLQTYQWIESTTLTIDGKSRPPTQSTCRYSADGTVLKTPLGSSAQQGMSAPMRGPMKHIVEEKIQKIQVEVGQIQALTQLYLPFDQATLKQVLRTGKVAFEHDGTKGDAVILNDYAKPGDQVRLALNRTTMQVNRISIRTYFDKPDNGMTVDVNFGVLPDGTAYPALTSIQAPSKKLSIATTNSDFSKTVH
jgi:hypothetical protein